MLLFFFLVAFLPGLFLLLKPFALAQTYKLSLAFAGAYLFAITFLHILPDLFTENAHPEWIGAFVLMGFILQQIMEFFSGGIEHGHLHVHQHNHKHSESFAWSALLALWIHGMMEGALLKTDDTFSIPFFGKLSDPVFWGILWHKPAEAIALMGVLVCEIKSRRKIILLLFIFSIATPTGIFLTRQAQVHQWLSHDALHYFFSLVAGSLLHISTTIVFENSQDHRFHAKKLLAIILGIGVAMGIELLV